MENPLLRLLIPMTTLQQLLRKSSTNSEMIRLSPTSSSCVMTTLAALYLYQVRRVLCSGLMPIPMERPRLHSKETTAPWKKWLHFLLHINMIHIHQSKNQAQTTKPIWITLLLHVKNLIIHNVSVCFGIMTPWCPPLWSYQGSSKSSNTKSCGCRLVGDEQGHPGDQGRCDWPEFWSRTWPMHIFQSAKSTKKGAVCQVPTVFLNCSASREILTKKRTFFVRYSILSNVQNRFKAG